MTAAHPEIFQFPPYPALAHHFAKEMVKLAGASTELYLACGLVCHHLTQGDVCLDLSRYASQTLTWQDAEGDSHSIALPPLQDWKEHLLATPIVGSPEAAAPLIFQETTQGKPLLYLSRYWHYETELADSLMKSLQTPPDLDEARLSKGLDQLFPPSPEEDLQREAAEMALKNRFCVISGGPGTGKTTTVVKILALLIQQTQNPEFQMALAAPTGKAAARLKDSVQKGKQALVRDGMLSHKESAFIPSDASTLHRLLEARPHSVYFRNNRKKLLPLDCLIVDEASMIDLALMSKLVEALPRHARLILLGDKNQLFSVEAGSFLGDLCEDFPQKPKILQSSIVHLKKSYRFDDQQGIGRLSREILAGEKETAWQILQEKTEEVHYSPLPPMADFKESLKKMVLPKYQKYLECLKTKTIEETFSAFQEFIILSAFRRGWYGSQQINRLIEELLREEQWVAESRPWYAGRPIMITRNDTMLELYNGDIGLLLPHPTHGQLRACFQKETGFRWFAPALLPEHETVFAMTVHKSQGSEFDEILLLLPQAQGEIVSRELLYTGLTRTKKSLTLWTEKHAFQATLENRTHRHSGFQEKLGEMNA